MKKIRPTLRPVVLSLGWPRRTLQRSRRPDGQATRHRTRGSSTPLSPSHIKETIGTITQLHTEHHQNASTFQQAIDRVTNLLRHPWFIGVLTLAVISWIGLNFMAGRFGYQSVDPPPFVALASGVSLASFYMMVLILVTQRRDDRLALHREQLILELVISSEQKTAKVIGLLEEFRRDDPLIGDRIDPEADVMAKPANPSSVLDEIKDIHAGTARRRRFPRGNGNMDDDLTAHDGIRR
jgi:uncharacterized membrane protein